MIRSARRRNVLALAWLVMVAACSGGDGSESLTEVTAQPIERTIAKASVPATTRVAVEVEPAAPPSTILTSPRVMPLTGLPASDPLVRNRVALVVKIDNSEEARPQAGLNQADIVIEEIVEGITRLFVVFHSQSVGDVGPVRSARTQDIDLVKALNRPLFTWSGGNAVVTRQIAAAPLVDLSPFDDRARTGGGFYRRKDRTAPHNYFAKGDGLWSLAPPGAAAPEQLLRFRDPAEDVPGEPASGVDLAMLGTRSAWRWDTASSSYLRTQDGTSHVDDAGVQVNAANVLVLVTRYEASSADVRSPEAQTVGFGDALIFTGGALIRGAWYRERADAGWGLADANGDPIALSPGRTWIELVEQGDATLVP